MKHPQIDLAIHGKTYREKQADLCEKAIEYSLSDYPFSWGELALWGEYFETNGRRYGLLREFRENGIC